MLAGALLAQPAHAQQKPPAQLTAATNELNAPDPVVPISVPEVSDPMLTLPSEAPQRIDSWAQALELVHGAPEYRTNFATIKRAEAQTRIALSSLLPIVNGAGAYTRNFNQVSVPFNGQTLVTPPPDTWTVGISAVWTPLNARAIYDYATTKQNVDATRLSFDDRRRQIAQGLVAAILATLAASRVAELNRVGLRSALERAHLTDARLQFGQGTPLDVDRANADVAAARRLIVDGDEALRRTREELGLAVASRVPVGVASSLDLESFEQAVLHTCKLNDQIENRPDVRAARDRVRIAKRVATSAELAPIPTLGFGSTFSYTTAPVLAPNTTFALEAILTIPFYDGGLRYGQLRDARAVAEQAAAALEQTRLDAIVASERAARNVDVARAARDIVKTERDLAARIDLRTRDAYARGRGTSLDLVTSAQALRLAEINLAILEFQFAQARANAVLENAECTF
jgi:outer membrane protein TolC